MMIYLAPLLLIATSTASANTVRGITSKQHIADDAVSREIQLAFKQLNDAILEASREHQEEDGQQHHDNSRQLQASNLLNPLIFALTPIINTAVVGYVQNNFEPFDINAADRKELGEAQLGNGVCNVTAAYGYDVGQLGGLGTIQLQNLALIPGSERITMSFMGLNGATWEGTWQTSAVFSTLDADAKANVTATACGIDFYQPVQGNVRVEGTQVDMVLRIAGNAPGLLTTGSNVDAIDVQEFDLVWDNLQGTVDASGGTIAVDVAADFDQLVTTWFNNGGSRLLHDGIQTAVNNILPYTITPNAFPSDPQTMPGPNLPFFPVPAEGAP